MQSIAIVIVYTIACTGMGSMILRLLRPKPSRDSLSFSFGLGSSILGAAWILVGLVGGLLPWPIWMLIGPLCIPGVLAIAASRPEIEIGPFGLTSALFCLGIFLVAGVLFWHGLLAYFRPPFGDADAFYMTYPKIIAGAGRLIAMGFVYNEFSSIGLSGELHFAVLMSISTPEAAKLFAWIAGLGTLLLVVEITGLVGGKCWAKLLTAAAFATSTTVTDYLSDGKTDLFSALIAATAIVMILKWRSAVFKPAFGVLLGVVIGTMAYAKFSYIVSMFPTLFAMAVFLVVQDGRKLLEFVKGAFWVGGGTVLGLGPHLLKNGLLFGHPAAPFLGTSSNWVDQAAWFSAADTAWIMLTLPVSLVFGQYPLMGGSVSVIWLLALPFAAFACSRRHAMSDPAVILTLSALIGLLLWLALKPSIFVPRYFLINLLMLFPIVFIGVERYAARAGRNLGVLAGFSVITGAALVSAPFVMPAGVWTATPEKLLRYVADGQPSCGLAISSYCATFQDLNAELPGEKRVFLLGYYSYFLSERLLASLNTNEENLDLSKMPADPWKRLAQQGFGAVAVQVATHGRFIDYLRAAPVPDELVVEERYPGTDMPVFMIRKKPAGN